jgi:hydrogenase maturation factor HypF (carbamoyltransferase family)
MHIGREFTIISTMPIGAEFTIISTLPIGPEFTIISTLPIGREFTIISTLPIGREFTKLAPSSTNLTIERGYASQSYQLCILDEHSCPECTYLYRVLQDTADQISMVLASNK